MKRNLLFLLQFIFSAVCAQSTFVVTNTNDSGSGSLREAIINANLTTNKDSIVFDIPGQPPHVISLSSNLDPIDQPVIVDGSTQPMNGFMGTSPKIEIKPQTGALIDYGLYFDNAGQSELYGLFLHDFNPANTMGVVQLNNSNNSIVGDVNRQNIISSSGRGLELFHTDSVIIQNNWFGVDTSGMLPLPNTYSGISMSSSNNIIVKNNLFGSIASTKLDIQFCSNLLIQGNYIGTDKLGLNGFIGMQMNGIFISNSHNIKIGGSNSGDGNLISGNDLDIVLLNTDSVEIYGNILGLNVTGLDTLLTGARSGFGVDVGVGSRNIIIGGLNPGEGNTISFKDVAIELEGLGIVRGNYFGTNINGVDSIANQTAIRVLSDSCLIEENIICNSKSAALTCQYCSHGIIRKNTIGINKNGQPAPNDLGIWNLSDSWTIDSNIVAYSHRNGIEIFDAATFYSIGNIISNNQIYNNQFAGVSLINNHNSNAVRLTTITHNRIYDNGAKGIDLNFIIKSCNDSVLPPAITYADQDSCMGLSLPNGLIEVYESQTINNYPQGITFLGSATSNAFGHWKLIAPIPNPANITATFTDALGNTSEFGDTNNVLGLNDLSSSPEYLSIIQNPSAKTITIHNTRSNQAFAVLFDISGREVLKETVNSELLISTANLNTGFYFLYLISDSSSRTYKLFVSK